MGFPTGISGTGLIWRGEIQAVNFGTRFVMLRRLPGLISWRTRRFAPDWTTASEYAPTGRRTFTIGTARFDHRWRDFARVVEGVSPKKAIAPGEITRVPKPESEGTRL